MSAIVATILLVAAAVAAAATVMLWAPDPAAVHAGEPVAFAPRAHACGIDLFAPVTSPVPWSELLVRVDGAEAWSIAVRDSRVANGTWSGGAVGIAGTVEATDVIRVRHEGGADAVATVVHAPSASLLAVHALPAHANPACG